MATWQLKRQLDQALITMQKHYSEDTHYRYEQAEQVFFQHGGQKS